MAGGGAACAPCCPSTQPVQWGSRPVQRRAGGGSELHVQLPQWPRGSFPAKQLRLTPPPDRMGGGGGRSRVDGKGQDAGSTEEELHRWLPDVGSPVFPCIKLPYPPLPSRPLHSSPASSKEQQSANDPRAGKDKSELVTLLWVCKSKSVLFSSSSPQKSPLD